MFEINNENTLYILLGLIYRNLCNGKIGNAIQTDKRSEYSFQMYASYNLYIYITRRSLKKSAFCVQTSGFWNHVFSQDVRAPPPDIVQHNKITVL